MYLSKVIDKPIWKFAHVSDGLLFLYIGKRRRIWQKDSHNRVVTRDIGEFIMHITGYWIFTDEIGHTISRRHQTSEDETSPFHQMETFAETFKSKKISAIYMTTNSELTLKFETNSFMTIVSSSSGGLSLRGIDNKTHVQWRIEWHREKANGFTATTVC
jgi:hypothetical protein